MYFSKVNIKVEFISHDFLTSSQASYKIKKHCHSRKCLSWDKEIDINKLTSLVCQNTALYHSFFICQTILLLLKNLHRKRNAPSSRIWLNGTSLYGVHTSKKVPSPGTVTFSKIKIFPNLKDSNMVPCFCFSHH